ncbi:nuclear envelope integral membrane protein 1b-like [Antedon mediterranea]|uniref:nuclear envelope integral membrane protein 1b-like n=1 Tax=Antedon mediterranea TaxID=105859 RepID=UPI003AF9383C
MDITIFYIAVLLCLFTCFQIGSSSSNNSFVIPVPYKVDVQNDSGCEIYCISSAESIGLTNLWKTIKVQAVCNRTKYAKCDSPSVTVGENEEKLKGSCIRGWLPKYSPWEKNVASVSPFKNICFSVMHDNTYKLTVTPYTAYLYYIALCIFGLVIFIYAPALSQNLLFYYSSGITIGVFASLIILVYILSRMIPRKTGAFAVIALGWSGALVILNWVFENIADKDYQYLVICYTGISSLISFAVCYYYGPSYHERAQKLVQWAIQLCALFCIYQSTHDQIAAVSLIVGLLTVINLPYGFFKRILPNLRWKFKKIKKPRFLTEEEYEEQAREETKSALDDLRKQCLSPQVKTWKMVSRLESPKRFAHFVLGESHLSGDEITAYDSDVSLIEDDDDTAEDNTSDIMTDDISYQEEGVII